MRIRARVRVRLELGLQLGYINLSRVINTEAHFIVVK